MIVLDARIREHALLPISLVVFLVSAMRSNLQVIFASEPKADLKEAKKNNMLKRCRILRSNYNVLCERSFRARKAYFVKKDQGVLVKTVPASKDPLEQMAGASDPMAFMGMMKGQMFFMISQGLLAYWVSHLFSGFLVGKAPFPLTFQCKGMMQRGVEVDSLDTSYVSALCWYMFIMMGSYNLVGLVHYFTSREGDSEEDNPVMAMMGGPGAGMMQSGPDVAKVYKQEAEGLEVISHEFLLENVETELWRKWKADRRA